MPHVKHCIIKAGVKELKRHAYVSIFFKRPTISALFLLSVSKKALEAARLPERFASLALTWKNRDFRDAPPTLRNHLLFLFHKSLLLRLLTSCGAASATSNTMC